MKAIGKTNMNWLWRPKLTLYHRFGPWRRWCVLHNIHFKYMYLLQNETILSKKKPSSLSAILKSVKIESLVDPTTTNTFLWASSLTDEHRSYCKKVNICVLILFSYMNYDAFSWYSLLAFLVLLKIVEHHTKYVCLSIHLSKYIILFLYTSCLVVGNAYFH